MSVVHQSPPTRTTEALVEHIDHFQRRVIQDALASADVLYWERRAAMFEWARPRPEDYAGRATRVDLEAADERCVRTAEACRRSGLAANLQDRQVAA